MDIRKPKAIHNWRDFIKEIGTIVIGVSIALAAEQGVERWREQRQYREARAAIRDELNLNIMNIKRRGDWAPCTARRLDEVGALLDRAETHQPFQAPNWIGGAQSLRVRFSAEAEVGKSNVFSTEEQRLYSRVYSYMRSFEEEQDRERLAWARLRMLEGRGTVPPEMSYGLRAALADARYENARIEIVRSGAIVSGEQMGLGADRAAASSFIIYQAHKWPHCLPMTTPRAEGERLSAIRFEANGAH
jgi:hypothetical protein